MDCLDNWRKLKGYGFNNFNSASSGQDKGHQNQFNLLINSKLDPNPKVASKSTR